jgi:MFS transporter, PAT family, beta-lactamase induction signal transducer AmpG
VSDHKVLADGKEAQTGWRRAVLLYGQPRMLSMLLLGFSAGLPFYLVFQSLSAWLRQEGMVRSTIGMFAWVGLAYSFKFIWSPIVDRMPLPLLTRLFGKRRSWMLLAQAGISFGLFNLSLSNPAAAVLPIALWALFVAFFAATQDIAVDAWRIETAGNDGQAAMASAYQIGYRIALIMGSAGTFALADQFGWKATYTIMAAMVSVGVVTTLMSKEPQAAERQDSLEREERVVSWLAQRSHWSQPLRNAGSWFIGAVVCPLLDFFGRYGWTLAVLILLFMCTYRLTDFTMGVMTNSFYIDKGYTLTQIAAVVKFYGLMMSIVGVILAGIVITKFGTLRSLILGSVMVMISNLGFSTLAAIEGTNLLGLGLVNGFDNLALAMHGTALITFLSSLTSPRYTATQYALFSSLYALPAKILEGFSGFVVDAIGYPLFFIYTASLSIPALLLLYWIDKHGVIKMPAPAAVPA